VVAHSFISVHVQEKETPAGAKPVPIRTHLRSVVIVLEIIGIIVGVYNGKYYYQVEIRQEMIGHYLAEFPVSYKSDKGVGMMICSC
jgi:small subunit ribosomal protein S15e